MVDRGLERGGDDEPEHEPDDRSADRRDRADERAVGQEHESQVLVGGAECGEHAELAQPPLRDDREAGGDDQRGQEHEHGDHGKRGQRLRGPVAPPLLGTRESRCVGFQIGT